MIKFGRIMFIIHLISYEEVLSSSSEINVTGRNHFSNSRDESKK